MPATSEKLRTVVAALSAEWDRHWPACRPIGHELRHTANATWVRFHNLPDSKRYPEDEADYDELLRRHNTLIAELAASSAAAELLVLTCAFSDGPNPVDRSEYVDELAPAAAYWTSVRAGDPELEAWTHLYASIVGWRPGVLDGMLRLAAADRIGGMIIASPDLIWLVHPYDGGADVIAASVKQRDELRSRHRDWLSRHPKGL